MCRRAVFEVGGWEASNHATAASTLVASRRTDRGPAVPAKASASPVLLRQPRIATARGLHNRLHGNKTSHLARNIMQAIGPLFGVRVCASQGRKSSY